MSTKLEDLQPEVRFKAASFIAALISKKIPHVVTSTLRTVDEQIAYYAQGRQPLDTVNALRIKAGLRQISGSENTYTVTTLDGIKHPSNHQSGRALDVVPANDKGNPIWPDANDPRWEEIALEGETQGFTWGGRWAVFPDCPHYEIT